MAQFIGASTLLEIDDTPLQPVTSGGSNNVPILLYALALMTSHTQSSCSTMGVNPGFETSLGIHLVRAEHLFVGHKALQYCRNAHVIDAHENEHEHERS